MTCFTHRPFPFLAFFLLHARTLSLSLTLGLKQSSCQRTFQTTTAPPQTVRSRNCERATMKTRQARQNINKQQNNKKKNSRMALSPSMIATTQFLRLMPSCLLLLLLLRFSGSAAENQNQTKTVAGFTLFVTAVASVCALPWLRTRMNTQSAAVRAVSRAHRWPTRVPDWRHARTKVT